MVQCGRDFRRDSPATARASGLSDKKCVLDLRSENDSVTDDSAQRQAIASRYRETRMNIWTEFKNAVLPWLLAGAVVGFLITEQRRTTAALVDANMRLANAVEQQGKALDGVRALLAGQGYTLPPLSKPQ